jgi:LysM repeat protein
VHDDPTKTQPPRIAIPDDAHVGRDPIDIAPPEAASEEHSQHAWVCPFLRSIGDDDLLGRPLEAPDPANRCDALHEAVPQSLRQQELVCLTSGHVNCPRYTRGSHQPAEPMERVTTARIVTPAIAGSVVVFVAAFLLSVAFVLANGGLILTAALGGPSPSGNVLAEQEAAAPTPAPTATPTITAAPTPSAVPTPSQTPVASPTPTASPSPTPKPAATPKPTWPAGATASRMKLLKPCPDKPDCYIYVIRSGDNLYSIANYFGVSFTTIKAWNPWTDSGLKIGRGLRIPPPTK